MGYFNLFHAKAFKPGEPHKNWRKARCSNVQCQKISMPTTWRGIQNSKRAGGSQKPKYFKRQYETKMELPAGWVLVQTQTLSMVGYGYFLENALNG